MQPDDHEEGDSEHAGEEQRAHQQVGLEAGAVQVEQPAEPRRALPEEELADDGADHRQPGRDAQADEDGGDGVGQLELQQPLQPARPCGA